MDPSNRDIEHMKAQTNSLMQKICIGSLSDTSVTLSPSELNVLVAALSPAIPRLRSLGSQHSRLLDMYDSILEAAPKNSSIVYSPHQLAVLGNFLVEIVDMEQYTPSKAFEELLVDANPRPLDFYMDRNKDYGSFVDFEYQGGILTQKWSGSTEEGARLCFFHCVQLVEALESRSSCLGRLLSFRELFSLKQMLNHLKKENDDQCLLHANYQLHNKLVRPLQERRDLWFSRNEVQQILKICARIPRPKSNPTTAKDFPIKYEYRRMGEIVLDSDVFTFRLRKAKEDGGNITLNYKQASDLYAFCMLGFEEHGAKRFQSLMNSSHPQVTGLSKITKALGCPTEDVVLSVDEAMALNEVVSVAFSSLVNSRSDELNFPTDDQTIELFVLHHRAESYRELIGGVTRTVELMAEIIPGVRDQFKKHIPSNLEPRLERLATSIKDLVKDRDDLMSGQDVITKDNNRLRKAVATKEKKLEEAEAKATSFREQKEVREAKLKAEISRLEYELDAAKTKLNNARGEPDKVRSEFSAKIQRLHDKVAARDKTIAEGVEAHDATNQELKDAKEEIARQNKKLKKWKEGAMKVKAELDASKAQKATFKSNNE